MGYAEFATNTRYIQSEGALKEFKRYVYGMGTRFLIVTACGVITDQVVSTITDSFNSTMESKVNQQMAKDNFKYAAALGQAKKYDAENTPMEFTFLDFEGKQVNPTNIDFLVSKAKEVKADVVVGIGGGKGLDLARAVSIYYPCKTVLVPTSPATNASGSNLVVLYDDEGKIDSALSMQFFPDLVLADLTVLAGVPWKMMTAGIGDAIGTSIETESFWVAMGLKDTILDGSWYGNQVMQRVIFECGRDAVKAAKDKVPNHAYESIMPYILHATGHQRYFRAIFLCHFSDDLFLYFDGPKKLQHGERVGYCVIPQLIFNKAPLKELHDYVDFCKDIEMPYTFKQLGLDTVSEKELRDAAEHMIHTSKIMAAQPFKFTVDIFVNSLLEGERLVQEYLNSK